ncbi:hypothetical protein QO002_001628 [Pararhizobium capsulatum DSM 1112]|uniref:Uncharacterized protein n=1 Tax=Pararhizobium capsulatum DSM 1112 TaxID=1121113 RepID=A0ABU0BPU5_9HYPH|nr:hypothetical protein [Pararhizobium capsulatum]MDQ0319490.1 hypothetical protein [Pararhizobium capsulatum DSM 1112]
MQFGLFDAVEQDRAGSKLDKDPVKGICCGSLDRAEGRKHGLVELEHVTCGATARVEVQDRVLAGTCLEHKRVLACAADQHVVAGAAGDGVIASSAVDGVGSGIAEDEVVASIAVKFVRARAAIKTIVAGTALEGVIAAFAVELVVAGTAGKRIGLAEALEDILASAADEVDAVLGEKVEQAGGVRLGQARAKCVGVCGCVKTETADLQIGRLLESVACRIQLCLLPKRRALSEPDTWCVVVL